MGEPKINGIDHIFNKITEGSFLKLRKNIPWNKNHTKLQMYKSRKEKKTYGIV